MAILALLLRCVGLVQYAVQIEQLIVKKQKAQEVANIPVTKKEWTDASDRGDL